MNRRAGPVFACLLAVLAACTTVAPTPTPATVPPSPTAIPTATLSLLPTPSVSPSPIPTASPPASPSASPTAPATISPTLPTSRAPVPSAVAAQLQQALDQIRADNGVPGVSAAVVMPDGSAWAGVSGESEVHPSVDVTPDTPFVIGSITKTFVAATIMKLADEGALSIDDPLAKWLADYPRAADITLRMLLSHTSGVYNYFEHPAYNRLVFGDPTRVWTPQQILDQFVLAPYCDPGLCYHYSNTGFILLGLVIEKQTGTKLGDVFRDRWFGPVGLTQTYWQYDTPLPADAAYGHLFRTGNRLIEMNDGSDYRPTRSAETVAWAAGAIAATGTDLANWCDALYGGHLLSPDALTQMTDYAANPYSDGSYALGTRTRTLDGRRMFGHTGSLRGFYAAMWHFPAENLTVAIELNLGRIDPNPLADQLAEIALQAAGYSPTLTLPPSASPAVSASP